MTAQLTDTQLVILNGAVQRSDHALLPFADSLTLKGATLDKAIAALRKQNLVEERRIAEGAAEWRRDEDNRAYGLFITTAGLLALGIEDADAVGTQQAAATMPRKRKTASARPRPKAQKKSSRSGSKRSPTVAQSKQDVVIKMLRRQSGATVNDIVAKTGWQPHSVRGFFSGLVKKKLKLPLASEVGKSGVRRYRIESVKPRKV